MVFLYRLGYVIVISKAIPLLLKLAKTIAIIYAEGDPPAAAAAVAAAVLLEWQWVFLAPV